MITTDEIIEIANYIIANKTTVRNTAKVFKLSKSGVYQHMTATLKAENYDLYRQVAKILKANKKSRHMRGGEATRQKWLEIKQVKTKQAHSATNY
jgi:putative DeoR family transcriptional regulator (stage III sporulation protein D)